MSPLEQARNIWNGVRQHKTLEHRHRRAAKAEARRLEAFCRKHGIELRLVKMTQTEEGQSHGTDPVRVA